MLLNSMFATQPQLGNRSPCRKHRTALRWFLHYYGEQSCTAGRAAFLTGQHGIRTGLTKVGFPGALPTVNGFDEFLGNLYHLNAEEPELPAIRMTQRIAPSLDHAVYSVAKPPTKTTRSSIRGSERSASRRSKTLVHSPKSEWKPWTTRLQPPRSIL